MYKNDKYSYSITSRISAVDFVENYFLEFTPSFKKHFHFIGSENLRINVSP